MTMDRRTFLRGTQVFLLASGFARRADAAAYRVGVGRESDPYGATVRAIDSCGQWPAASVFGKKVVIKPNLVSARTADSGITTDPEVVRAVVDRALANGASEVVIVEASPQGALFGPCGYNGFASYDPRVRLMDLNSRPPVLAPVPSRMAYQAIYVDEEVLGPDVFFISVGKLKTHGDSVATLSMKNLFGLPAVDRYISFPPIGRFAMHDRSLHQTVVDLCTLRPVHFAVIDGIVGMEGKGPIGGTPVRMDTVIAGLNACAVDRVSLAAMQIPQHGVKHLDYAASRGMGPMEMSEIDVAGDALAPRAFQLPPVPPIVEYPRVFPSTFVPTANQSVQIFLWYAQTYVRKLEVLRVHENSTAVELIRTLSPYRGQAAGFERAVWDGRADDGSYAAPGRYMVHAKAFHVSLQGRPGDVVGWVTVGAS